MVIETNLFDIIFGAILFMVAGTFIERAKHIKDVRKLLAKDLQYRLRPIKVLQMTLLFGGIAAALFLFNAPVSGTGVLMVWMYVFTLRKKEVNYSRWASQQAMAEAIRKVLPF